MDGPKILASYREELAEHLKAYTPPQSIALPISPWLAMSILQKAVRRGRRDLALQAAATLLQDAPDRLWRRLGTVAYEDVGVPSLATVGLVTAALVGKQFRATVGGEWAVASFLVDRLVAAPKNRGADDLYMVCERHPSFRSARQELAHLDIDRLIVLATGNAELPLRALAAWFALGTDRCPSPYLATRRGKPDRLLDVFCETGYQHTAYELGREAFRKIGLPHCIFVPMLLAIRPHVPAEIADDQFPPEEMIWPIPTWALDMFTREGRTAIRRFLNTRNDTSSWIKAQIPTGQQTDFLGNVLFAVEGGLLRDRYRWPMSEDLRRRAEVEAQGHGCGDATEIMSLLRADIGLLNEVRSHVL